LERILPNLCQKKFLHCNDTEIQILDKLGGENMNDMLRGLIAGAAAWKLGGGIISMILIFIVVFWLLGKC